MPCSWLHKIPALPDKPSMQHVVHVSPGRLHQFLHVVHRPLNVGRDVQRRLLLMFVGALARHIDQAVVHNDRGIPPFAGWPS